MGSAKDIVGQLQTVIDSGVFIKLSCYHVSASRLLSLQLLGSMMVLAAIQHLEVKHLGVCLPKDGF